MTDDMRAICMGVHVLDVLVRPVEAIPEGQGGELVEEIRITATGSAGGTALVLAKLGARVKSADAAVGPARSARLGVPVPAE
jgi:sugar/nucleoside kinase (ribokinase family)